MIFEKNIKYFGQEIFEKFKNFNIAVIGAGGTGTPVCQLLVSLGIHKITVYDYDKIDYSNLNRQFMYDENEVGLDKSEILVKKISKRHKNLIVTSEKTRIDEENFIKLQKYDFIFDCTDSFNTKFFLNDLCIKNHKILVHSGVNLHQGQAGIINFKTGGCLRCFIKKKPEEVENINVAHNVMLAATLQVEEFVNFLSQEYYGGLVFFKTKPNIFIKKIQYPDKCDFCGGYRSGN